MEIRQVLLARSIQLFRTNISWGYLPDLAKKITDRYEFVVAPKKEDLLPQQQEPIATQKGVEFKHGRLTNAAGRALIVQQLTVFSDGLVADTTTSTEDSDVLLKDLVAWAQTEIQSRLELGATLYLSQLEIHPSSAFESLVPLLASLGTSVSKLLKEYGLEIAPFQFSEIALNPDPIGLAPPTPSTFQLQRRVNVPYKSDMWFSQAPLKSKDHIKVLQDLESRL